jgi:hypothetical protein
MSSEHPALAGDLIWGAAAIAAELGIEERRAFYLLDRRLIPARKIGTLWCASRHQLRVAFLGDPTTNDEAPPARREGPPPGYGRKVGERRPHKAEVSARPPPTRRTTCRRDKKPRRHNLDLGEISPEARADRRGEREAEATAERR